MIDLIRLETAIEYWVWNHPSERKPRIISRVAKYERNRFNGIRDIPYQDLRSYVGQVYDIMTRCKKLTDLRKRAKTSLESLKEARSA